MRKTDRNNVVNKVVRSQSDDGASGQHSRPGWNKSVLPTLRPIMSDHKYLEEQHLLLAIKSVDNDESYGECCIALRTMINVIPQKCDGIVLSHLGEKTGEIDVEMHVKLPDKNNMETSSQPVDLISIGDLEEVTRKGSVRSPQVRKRRSFDPRQESPRLPEKQGIQGNVLAENPPAIPKRYSAPSPDTTKASKDPPPLPVKKSKPQTVQEVMQRIGLPQYTDRLLADGWDELEFLRDLTEADLESAEVPKDHRRVILAAITRYIS